MKLNKLIWDVSAKAHNNDKKLQNMEKYFIKAGIDLTKTMVSLSKMEKECSGDLNFTNVLNSCEDAFALLGQANVDTNMTQRDFLLPELKSEYAHLYNRSYPSTSELFGDDVSKAAKELRPAIKWETGYSLLKTKEILAFLLDDKSFVLFKYKCRQTELKILCNHLIFSTSKDHSISWFSQLALYSIDTHFDASTTDSF